MTENLTPSARFPRIARRGVVVTSIAAVIGLTLGMCATAANAATPNGQRLADYEPINYHVTGATQTVPVPAGVQGVLFTAVGGSGGAAGGKYGSSSGFGAEVGGYVPVSDGDTLTINVGQAGQSDGVNGWGGLMPGGQGGSNTAGGGGGASTIAVDGDTLAVAGGGGGGGAFGTGSGVDGPAEGGGNGGNAGSSAGNGQAGEYYLAKGGPAGGAGGGAGADGGAQGAAGNTTKLPDGVNGAGGGGGGGVTGGAGGTVGATSDKGSGGGGGGAGTSMVANGVFGPTEATATTSGDGEVQILWLTGFGLNLMAPAATGTASLTPMQFAVTGTDPNGKAIGDVSKYVTLTSSDPTDKINGMDVRMTDAGPHQITATWTGTDISSSVIVTVNPGAPTALDIQGLPQSIPAGIPLQLGAVTVDEFGNPVQDISLQATWKSNVASDTWNGNTVTMTQPGVHAIEVSYPGYYSLLEDVTVTAS